jgi:hypothetical protein
VKSQAQVERDRIAEAERAEQAAQVERERMLNEIRSRLLANIPTHASSEAVQGHKVSVDRQIQNVFAFKNNEELAAVIYSMDEKKRLSKMSPAELRKALKQGNSQPPVLPSEFTAEVLQSLIKSNLPEFKRLVKFYGSEAIDARRGYVSPSSPGIVVRG